MKRHLLQKQTFISLLLWAAISFTIAVGLPGLSSAFSVHAIESPATQVSQPSSSQSPLREGIEHYEAERYQEAIESWQQALNVYESMGDEHHQALVSSSLSLAYQHLGQWSNAETALNESLGFFNQQSEESRTLIDWEYYAKALNAKGWFLWRRGQLESALDAWRETTDAYEIANHFPGFIGSQINQAKALQSLGSSVAAADVLSIVQENIQLQSDPQLKLMALQSVGNALRRVGKLDDSEKVLNDSLMLITDNRVEFSSDDHRKAVQSSILLDLGNIKRAQWERAVALNLDEIEDYRQAALAHYQESEAIAPSFLPRVQAIANHLSLVVDIQKVDQSRDGSFNAGTWSTVQELWETLRSQFKARVDFTQSESFYSVSSHAETIASTESQIPPLGRADIEVQLNSVNSLLKLLEIQEPNHQGESAHIWTEISEVLAQSIQQAQLLEDKRIEALALGQLGNLYELANQFKHAKSITQEAIFLSESIQAADIQYRWEWQLGRILKHQDQPNTAAQAFDQSVNTLEKVRQNLLFIDSEVQFSLRDNVEPLYRQYVDLLLENLDPNNEQYNDQVGKVTELIDALQLAELENFLGCNIDPIPLAEKVIDPEAAILYPIILEDRLTIILALPDPSDNNKQRFIPFSTNVSKDAIEELLPTFRRELANPRSNETSRLTHASQLYEWLIRPAKNVLNELDASGKGETIQTLAFVLDGDLRNVPMAALWDQQNGEYLIDQYAIAVSPSMQLVDPQAMSQPIRVLAAGTTEALDRPFQPGKFIGLEKVKDELETIERLLPTEILLDSAFTKTNLATKIQEGVFSIIHIATHGVFSSEPSRTFIAISNGESREQQENSSSIENNSIIPTRGNEFRDVSEITRLDEPKDEQPNVLFANQLDVLLRNRSIDSRSIDLLVLSACTTAQGDNRATLGIAGLSIRAGARSTLATLWSVYDEPAAMLMQLFYQQLAEQPGISRAKALQQAQVQLRNQPDLEHPSYWSSYIIVGNWL